MLSFRDFFVLSHSFVHLPPIKADVSARCMPLPPGPLPVPLRARVLPNCIMFIVESMNLPPAGGHGLSPTGSASLLKALAHDESPSSARV